MDGSDYEELDGRLNVLRLAFAMLAAHPGRTEAVRELMRVEELNRQQNARETSDDL